MNILKLIFLIVFIVNLAHSAEPYVDKESLDAITKKYKMFAKKRFYYLQQTLERAKDLSDREKLEAVNQFYNEVRYASDMKVYNKKDYWATPSEFLGKDMGDCEDYVIAKYFALRYLNIPSEKLFFTYVKSTKFKEAHMVLTYYETPHSEPLILDNNNRRIFPASKRKDLIPIYNFNGESLKKSKQKKSHKKWDELKLNMQRKKI